MTSPRKRVLSGMQPSGLLHLGNYLGALENWKTLQDQFDCYFFVADWHALSSNYADTSRIREFVRELLIDWLAAGIDPAKATVFVQSRIPEHAVLHLLLSMMTPVSWLERNPTYKEKQEEIKERDMTTYGFLGYPVLQAADILLYKPDFVPVGKDQLPHLELAREIARRFNSLFGNTFPEPEAKLTSFPLIMGLNGKEKMSKQLDNDIQIAFSPQETIERVMTAVTDPARRYRDDPGHPEICNIYYLHKYFNPSQVASIAEQCRVAKIGCVDCKMLLAEGINSALKPFRERRAALDAKPQYVTDVLADGARRAEVIARETLREVKQRMGLI